jgi:multicomponent Na+:H+ antiporter subunit A
LLPLVVAHFVAACVAPALVTRFGRNAYFLLAAVPAAAFGWCVVATLQLESDGDVRQSTAWLPSLGLDLSFWFDPLSALLALLVTGIGALVIVYCARYMPAGSAANGRFAGVLLAFAGAMLGLVLSDNTMLLYVFWELTTVFSYLLIGHSAHRKTSRRAAMQALLVTTAGGLAMLVGLVVLGETGSYELSVLLADPPTGTAAEVAVLLVLIGALSKSAIFPFHFWLPAAMAAPTPVSAYLHAAAMVKAGVYLIARLSPAFAEQPLWRPLLVTLGVITMLLGGWRALRQTDLKLLLAFGTVSQLGLLTVLAAWGTREAALACGAMLVAHALFKSTLFLVVGVIDRVAGTREIPALSGLGRRLPVVATTAAIAGASMAGIPPLAGFVGKEAAYATFTEPVTGLESWSTVVLVLLVAGSVLTFAYTGRFLWGAFATKRDAGGAALPDSPVDPPNPVMVGVPALLSGATVVVGLFVSVLLTPVELYADSFVRAVDPDEYLALWHGVNLALALSAVTLALGALLVVQRRRVDAVLARVHGPGDADLAYRQFMRGVDGLATKVTAAVQRGSVSTYLATILAVLVLAPGSVLLVQGAAPDDYHLWDSPLQLLVAVLSATVVVTAAVVRQRLTAVLLVGASGYGIGVLFVIHGAPDLALTQFLVESMTLVVFVLVLRKLPKQIIDRHTRSERLVRLLVAVPAGLLMAGLGAAAIGTRSAPPVSDAFADAAYEFGGGRNVVNVTLVDIRAWDTFLEMSVLVAAATGVASLVFLRKRTGAPPVSGDAPTTEIDPTDPTTTVADASGGWLRSSRAAEPAARSLVLEFVTRMTFHTMLVLSIYLLFAGHNVPGGGFAGGLVAGLAFVVRYLAGGRYELGEAAPVDAGLLLGLGLLLAGGTGVVGLLLGADVLQTTVLSTTLPLLGDIKLVTSLFFDMGVYLVVVGLVLDVLRSLGAEIDRREVVS